MERERGRERWREMERDGERWRERVTVADKSNLQILNKNPIT